MSNPGLPPASVLDGLRGLPQQHHVPLDTRCPCQTSHGNLLPPTSPSPQLQCNMHFNATDSVKFQKTNSHLVQ